MWSHRNRSAVWGGVPRNQIQQKPAKAGNNPARSGTVMAEFALTFPLFVLIFFGMCEFGRAYMLSQTLHAAARRASRSGVTEGSTTQEVIDEMQTFLAAGGLNLAETDFFVVDASGFDTDPTNPPTLSSLIGQGNFEILDAEPRQMIVVGAQINFRDYSLLPVPQWLGNLTVTSSVAFRRG